MVANLVKDKGIVSDTTEPLRNTVQLGDPES